VRFCSGRRAESPILTAPNGVRRPVRRCHDAAMEFPDAVNRHLAAIGARDLDGYLATVHPDVTLITER